MKILFAGPTLPVLRSEEGRRAYPSLTIAPPARQGDVLAAVLAGAESIGIVDGYFEQVASVWHKEILFALARGVPVYGAASMGALRAAECAAFGMVAIGTIAWDYVEGRRIDDADVAQLHGPEELGYPSLTEPMVNVEAVLAEASIIGTIDASEQDRLLDAARTVFFKDRTWQSIFHRAGGILTLHQQQAIEDLAIRVNLKREDAKELADLMERSPSGERRHPPPGWRLNETSQLKAQIERLYYLRQHNH